MRTQTATSKKLAIIIFTHICFHDVMTESERRMSENVCVRTGSN